jgi:hypothetical protein
MRVRVAVPLLLSVLAGCSSGEAELLPVKGRVLVDGEPARHGGVAFHPDGGVEGNHLPTGTIDAEGYYVLRTMNLPGAPRGRYRVLVFVQEQPPPGQPTPSKPKALIHDKYFRAQTTDLVVEVRADAAPGAYDLQVSR